MIVWLVGDEGAEFTPGTSPGRHRRQELDSRDGPEAPGWSGASWPPDPLPQREPGFALMVDQEYPPGHGRHRRDC